MFAFKTIETERTILDVLTFDYKDEVLKHFSDVAITEFMDIEPCKDVQEAVEIIQYHLDDAGSRWAILDRDNRTFMGTCGFHYVRESPNGTIAEIGFDLAKAYWRKGMMIEVLHSLIEYGFTEMALHMIDATVDPNNKRSLKLMEKLGFQRHQELQDGLVYFTLSR